MGVAEGKRVGVHAPAGLATATVVSAVSACASMIGAAVVETGETGDAIATATLSALLADVQTLRESAKKKDEDKTNEVLQRIHFRVRKMRPE